MRRMRSKPTFWPMRGPEREEDSLSVREVEASGMMMIPAGDEVSTMGMMPRKGKISTVVIMTTVGGSGGASVTMRVTVEFEKGR